MLAFKPVSVAMTQMVWLRREARSSAASTASPRDRARRSGKTPGPPGGSVKFFDPPPKSAPIFGSWVYSGCLRVMQEWGHPNPLTGPQGRRGASPALKGR